MLGACCGILQMWGKKRDPLHPYIGESRAVTSSEKIKVTGGSWSELVMGVRRASI